MLSRAKFSRSNTLGSIKSYPARIKLSSSPIQVEMMASPAMGAAVASIIKASFSRLTLNLSVTGRIMGPTISEFA